VILEEDLPWSCRVRGMGARCCGVDAPVVAPAALVHYAQWGGLHRLRVAAMMTIYLWYFGLVHLVTFANLGEGMVGTVGLAFLLLLPEPTLLVLLLCQEDKLSSKSGDQPLG